MVKAKRPSLGQGITPAAPASSLASIKPKQDMALEVHADEEPTETRTVGRPRSMHTQQRTFTMRLEAPALKHLNLTALERDTTAKGIILEALDEWYRKRGIAPIVSK